MKTEKEYVLVKTMIEIIKEDIDGWDKIRLAIKFISLAETELRRKSVSFKDLFSRVFELYRNELDLRELKELISVEKTDDRHLKKNTSSRKGKKRSASKNGKEKTPPVLVLGV